MNVSSQKETYDSYTPSCPSSRTSVNGVLLVHRSSKETIQSYQGSISNSTFHTNYVTTAAIDEDLAGLSRQGPLPLVPNHPSNSPSGRVSISDNKSFHSLEKMSSELRNQSLSTVCTIREYESNHNSTMSSIPMWNFCSPSLSYLQDEAESFLPSTPSYSRAIAPTLISDPGSSRIPVYVDSPTFPLDDDDSQPLANMEICTTDTPSIGPASFLPRPTERMGTSSRSRSSMVSIKNKKGILGFMSNFLNSKKFPGMPKGRRRPLQDSGISESHQKENPPANGDALDNPTPGSSQSPSIPGAVRADPGLSRSVDDSSSPTVSARSSQPRSDSSKRQVVSHPERTHYSSGPQATSHPPVSYDPAPSPPRLTQPSNLDWSNSQRSVPRPSRSDTLICEHTTKVTKDQPSPGPPASFNLYAQELSNYLKASTVDLAINLRATVAADDPVVERQAPHFPTTPQQQRNTTAVASLARTADVSPQQHKKEKEERIDDADVDTVKRLQQICTNADPTQLYRNLVKIKRG